MMSGHTLGPWSAHQEFKNRWRIETWPNGDAYAPVSVAIVTTTVFEVGMNGKDTEANARLIAAAPDLYEATVAFKAWLDAEDGSPDYGQFTRDTHPEGEAIWRVWFYNNIDLCAKAQELARAAIAKAEGRT